MADLQSIDWAVYSLSTLEASTAVGTHQSTGFSQVVFTDVASVPSTSKSAFTFESRYLTLDSAPMNQGGLDLAYMRILNYTDGQFGAQVFPQTQTSSYQEFIIVASNFQHVEKAQIIKTNKTLQAYFFDSQPEVINLSGFLKVSDGNRQDLSMVLLWDNLLRATSLVRYNRILEIGFQGHVYWGYPLSFQYAKSAQSQYVAQFQMQILIVKRSSITLSGADPLMLKLSKSINELNKAKVNATAIQQV